MAYAIWKDIVVSLGTASTVDYRIRQDSASGAVIYSGRSYKRPGEVNNTIKINSVVAEYFTKGMPGTGNPYRTFVVEYKSGAAWVSAGTYSVKNDWSYDSLAGDKLSDPIIRRLDGYRDFYRSVAPGTTSVSVEFYDEDGALQETITLTPTDGNIAIELGDYPYAKMVIGDEEFSLVRCHRYTLQYVNAFGGWDQLLIEANTSEADTITRKELEHTYSNISPTTRGRENYHNTIRTTLTMHTDWLSDEESLRMGHLLESANVYLQDGETGIVYPAVITNAEWDKKVYRNGRQMVAYDITVELANDRQRR